MKMLAILLFLVAFRCSAFILKGASEYIDATEKQQQTLQYNFVQANDKIEKQMKSGKIGIAMGLVGTVAFTWWGIKTWKKAYTGN